jgi:YesN/AraC family two-component response regulator
MLAKDGEQAVRLYARHRDTIAVMLTDMMMPVMDGPSAIQAILKMNPAVIAIAASGITTGECVAKAMNSGAKMFLPKPFTTATLSRALKKVLMHEPEACALSAN